ncbi:HigA family addiction module antidote protein [Desulforhopalus vacuolatus]|uniref:HigA family addiction module antitoxin n=1 Tax=Desulforhopalus vacuolatus TaxID=40414 RepID=UPI001966902F|nr:HigA family addiction module antitoxin [Desulforhopalus vacuolatus]MBM9520964.1 HigA family addiction module antidote protein [Desulforhopalus vacuolatus]
MVHKIPLEHPGIIVKEEFLEALELTVYAVSKGTGIPQTALGEILKGKRNISPINALKLSKFFNVSENFFLKIQSRYDLDKAKEKAEKPLSKIIPFKRIDLENQESLEA